MSSQPDPPPAAPGAHDWDWHVPRTDPRQAPTAPPPDPAASSSPALPPDGPASDRSGRGGLIAIAVVAVVAIAITALVAVLGDGAADRDRDAAAGCEPGHDCAATGGPPPSAPAELTIPEDRLGVVSLGALTPRPDGPWSDYIGPGADELLADDAHAVYMPHTANWISYFMVGRLGEFALDADPDDLGATATEIIDTWVFDYPYGGTTGLERSTPELHETVVDGHRAVLLETRVSWDSLDASPDTYEDVALLLVDPGEGGIFLGVAASPESGSAHYAAAVEALRQTTFQHGTFMP